MIEVRNGGRPEEVLAASVLGSPRPGRSSWTRANFRQTDWVLRQLFSGRRKRRSLFASPIFKEEAASQIVWRSIKTLSSLRGDLRDDGVSVRAKSHSDLGIFAKVCFSGKVAWIFFRPKENFREMKRRFVRKVSLSNKLLSFFDCRAHFEKCRFRNGESRNLTTNSKPHGPDKEANFKGGRMKPSLKVDTKLLRCARATFTSRGERWERRKFIFLAAGFLPDRRGEAESDPITIFRIGLNWFSPTSFDQTFRLLESWLSRAEPFFPYPQYK